MTLRTHMCNLLTPYMHTLCMIDILIVCMVVITLLLLVPQQVGIWWW